jgi:hypothetical protein
MKILKLNLFSILLLFLIITCRKDEAIYLNNLSLENGK